MLVSYLSMPTNDAKPRHLFIISRETPYLADYMREQFRDEPEVQVLVDRRRQERRATPNPVDADRRSSDRRERREVDRELRESFHAFVTLG
jgi:hypothetical protein